MLIHQQDNLVIDLEKNKDLCFGVNSTGEGFSLILSIQVNGKISRSKQTVFVYSGLDMNKQNDSNFQNSTNECYRYADEARVISNYLPIYAVLDLLNDIGYKLKSDENDYSYNGIMGKLQEAIDDYYKKD